MDILDSKSDNQIAQSMLAEIAKAKNEVNCARNDLNKAHNRLTFLVVLANELINRSKDTK